MTRRVHRRPINKYRLLGIDESGILYTLGPRGGTCEFRRTIKGAYKVWHCCQCQGRIDQGESMWGLDRAHRMVTDRICEGCASDVPGYKQTGATAAERRRPSAGLMERSPLLRHAYRELDLATLFDDDVDIGGCVIKMVEALARHDTTKPGAFDLILKTFWDVAHMRPLTGLRSHPYEWEDISAASGSPLWRSIRDPDAYSTDGGKTFYRTDQPNRRLASRPVQEKD